MWLGGAVGAGLGWRTGHCQDNPAWVVHGARSSGLGLGSAGDPKGAGGAMGSSCCCSRHLAQALLSVHKNLGLIQAMASTGRC